jgi:endonuclease YncB( thermonuclease family)
MLRDWLVSLAIAAPIIVGMAIAEGPLPASVLTDPSDPRCFVIPVAAPVRIIDGDTFVADLKIWPGLTARETVRVWGINAPEMKGATRQAAEAAKQFAATWLAKGEFYIGACDRDAFGRILSAVWRGSSDPTAGVSENLGEQMIGAGHAVRFRR